MGAKLSAYIELDSLQEYWIAQPDRVLLTQYVRDEENWLLYMYTQLEATLHSPLFGIDVPLNDLYALVLNT